VAAGVVFVRVVGIVRGDPLDTHLLADLHELVVQRLLDGDAVVLELEVETIAEQLPVLGHLVAGPREVAGDDQLGDLGRQTARQADEAVGVLGEQVLIGPRVVVEALEPGFGRDLDEVRVALVGRGEQREVAGALAGLLLGRLLAPVAEEEIALHPEDRLHAGLRALLVELERPVHDPVVGDGAGAHPVVGGRVEHLGYPARAVEHRIFRMCVQMDEAQTDHPAGRHPGVVITEVFFL
jgi:hypothetical protein